MAAIADGREREEGRRRVLLKGGVIWEEKRAND